MPVECCTNEQLQFIVDYSCFALACVILWRSRLLYPMKLFCTFLHEFGHASAAWMMCARVDGIEVHADQGGLTHWSSTRPKCAGFVVMPAGYLGSAFWAGALVLSSMDNVASVIMAIGLCVAMVVVLCYQACGKHAKPEATLTVLLVSLLVILAGLIAMTVLLDWEDRNVPLRMVLLLMGVMNSIFATWNIYTDCIAKDDPRSDAHKFAESVPCCFPRVIGVLWIIVDFAFILLCIFLTLWLASAENHGTEEVDSIDDIHALTWLAIAVGVGSVVGALIWHRCCQGLAPSIHTGGQTSAAKPSSEPKVVASPLGKSRC
mmetsp:Transcript_69955/g.167930  ORF Transcript_69955/g.167930 Transcript_69955/m.167930 type:complete len:318 (+) Transcript_69955:113-1066(+)